MKKTNLMTLLSFVLLIVMVILVMILWKTPSENTDDDTRVPASQQTTFVSDTQTDVPDTSKKEKPKIKTTVFLFP